VRDALLLVETFRTSGRGYGVQSIRAEDPRGPGRVALGRKPAGFRLPNQTRLKLLIVRRRCLVRILCSRRPGCPNQGARLEQPDAQAGCTGSRESKEPSTINGALRHEPNRLEERGLVSAKSFTTGCRAPEQTVAKCSADDDPDSRPRCQPNYFPSLVQFSHFFVYLLTHAT